MTSEKELKNIISYCKENGFIYKSSDIYEGLSAVYDYGYNGVELKNNLKQLWWKSMVNLHNNIIGIDSSILMNPKTWEASGHIDSFNDLLIDNKDSKKRYRVDHLIENYANKLKNKSDANNIIKEMNKYLDDNNIEKLEQMIKNLNITEPETGSKNWSRINHFNLMFKTEIGSNQNNKNIIYLRPETAQGIFINFSNIIKNNNLSLPFGVAQIGKAFRNEIIARQFIFRQKEFEQMEMQFFIKPGTDKEWFDIWIDKRMKWNKILGLEDNKLQLNKHNKLAHYANYAVDIEYKYPFGFKELEGIHSRTDYDLRCHERLSGKKLKILDKKNNTYINPFIIETSIGLDRLFLAVICNGLKNQYINNKERKILKIHPVISPIKAAILPLIKNNDICEIAMKLYNELKLNFNIVYNDKNSIGKRYRKMDEIGTPLCITIDFESLSNKTVTVRDRDTMKQTVVSIEQLNKIIDNKVNFSSILKLL